MPLDVLHHDDRVIHHEPHREHDGEQGEEIDGEAGDQHEEHGADERDRDRDDRDDHSTHRAEEQEDHEDDDQQRLTQRLEHLVDGVLDVLGRVVRNPRLDPGGQLRLDPGHGVTDPPDHLERVGRGEYPDAHERRALAVEAHVLLVVLRSQHDIGDVAEPDHVALVFLHHQPPELFGSLKVRVRDQVHRDHRTLGLAQRREVVVLGQSVADLGGRNAHRRHLLGLEPDSHRERAAPEDLGALDPGDRAELGLDDTRQVVGDLVLV